MAIDYVQVLPVVLLSCERYNLYVIFLFVRHG